MRVELTEAFWLDDHRAVPLPELAELSGLSEAELGELVDCGAIAPMDPDAAERVFRADCIVAARTACRLRHDFELDTQALALALTLIERVHELEGQIRDLRARLSGRFR